MASKILILALVFFFMVCMAFAIDDPTIATLNDANDAPIAVENNNIIGTINGSYDNEVVAAAPVGGPISGHTFPNISLPPIPNGAITSTPDFTTIATTIISVGTAALFFF